VVTSGHLQEGCLPLDCCRARVRRWDLCAPGRRHEGRRVMRRTSAPVSRSWPWRSSRPVGPGAYPHLSATIGTRRTRRQGRLPLGRAAAL